MQRTDVTNIQMREEGSSRSEPQAKWGEAIKAGFQVLPDALIRGQHLLELSATDVVVIANLNQAWWFADSRPYLQPHTIAKRMGVSERSVQRSLNRLRRKGYLRQVRERQNDGTVRYYHDLAGLRGKLEQLARRDIRYSEALQADIAD
jgi:predicted transcriptional regulator